MRILVINLGLLCLCFLSNAYATSDEWTQRWKSSSARSNENLVQANLIELKESDYYSGLGKTTVHSTSTTSIGTVNTPTNNIDITSELLNEAPVNSNTNQNPQRCLNLSNRPGESQC